MSEPWPISAVAAPLAGRATASQRWSDLIFLHWRVDAEQVAPLLPEGLRPDVFDGSSWVGLIPFVLDRATVFGSGPVPYLGSFVEVNVRLYAVDSRGWRGVVFVSLEASRLAAVLAARAIFAIPYVWSRTRLEVAAGEYRYSSTRHLAAHARTRIVARSTGHPVVDDPLADFLTARWALFTRVRGRTIRLRNHHQPWRLYTAELVLLEDTLLAEAGFPGVGGIPCPGFGALLARGHGLVRRPGLTGRLPPAASHRTSPTGRIPPASRRLTTCRRLLTATDGGRRRRHRRERPRRRQGPSPLAAGIPPHPPARGRGRGSLPPPPR